MLHPSRISLTLIVLSIVVLACALPTITLPDSAAISTAAAQTVIAGFVQTALSETLLPTLQEPTLTFTPGPPTFTPTSTFTPSPTLTATLAFTPTPLVPQVSVSVATNCRLGPGKVYRMVGAILVGQVAQVYGRNPTGEYWYIRNPDSGSEFCWIWGEYATVTGNIALLPVYTPPPTPTPTFTPTPSPNFKVSYSGMGKCATKWWVEFELENTGSMPFKSMGITVRDTVTKVVVANFTDGFTNRNGCNSTTRDVLGAGKTRIVSAPAFDYDPRGHKFRATIILCSGTGQNGTCITKTIVFKP